MELYTLDRTFHKKEIIDRFTSLIWTERYYGDSGVELVVPATPEMIMALPEGIFLGIADSDEIMILETAEINEGMMKISGMSILPWLNNRFVRASTPHEDRYFYLTDLSAGKTLWTILYYMCVQGSPFLDGTNPTGIPSPENLVIPGLNILSFDDSGPTIKVAVPYGPLYNALKEIATTFQVGMKITLESVTDDSYFLGFKTYKGIDRTSDQTDNPPVQFSPQMDSLTKIKELRSIAALKTLVYAFAPVNPDGLATDPGVSSLPGLTGFDLRAQLVFADDITTDLLEGDSANLLAVLNSRAHDVLTTNRYIAAVDGEIVPMNPLTYGNDYNLGDIVEMRGYSGIVNAARVTEYIRSQDATGQKAYPTLEKVE